ncbi:MAG: transglutaminase domain-containing protein [Oscillospiraceae bacterium]
MNKFIAVILAAAAVFFFGQIVPTQSIPDIAKSIEHPYAASIVKQQGANRETLSAENKELYDVIKTGLINHEDEILVRRFSYGEEDVRDVLWYIMSDSPELFWVDWSWDVRSQDNGFIVAPRYIYDKADTETKSAEINAALDKIVSLAAEAGAETEYDKVLFVHDYLIKNCKYDEQTTQQVHTAYGALVAQQAVCDGYAHATQLILNKMGIANEYVEGTGTTAKQDEGHAWNVVSIDGKYYHLDITWDDRDAEQSDKAHDSDIVSYNYFLLGDEDIAIDHKTDNKAAVPACPESYGYFKKLGLEGNLFEDIFDKVVETVIANVDKDIYFIEFRVADEADYKAVCDSADSIGKVIETVNKELKYKGYSTRLGDTYSLYRSDERNSALVVFEVD